MNESRLKGDWKVMRGKVKERWAKLSYDDLDAIDGRRDELVGRIQQAYGRSVDEVEREIDEFERSFTPSSP